MSLAIIDAREWQNVFDLRTGRKRLDDSPKIQLVKKVLARHPFPGDMAELSNRWVTDTALDLVEQYDSRFAFLVYAQQYYAFRFEKQTETMRERLIDSAFNEVERFTRETGFTPLVVGTGAMVPATEYIDLSSLDGLAITSHWLTQYAGLYDMSTADLAVLRKHAGIERLVSREEFKALFNEISVDDARLPELLAVAHPGYCFRSTLLRRPVMISAQNYFVPISTALGEISSLLDISPRIDQALQDKKVALIFVEGVGMRDFRLPFHSCANGRDWFFYENGDAQYLTASIGSHQVFAYPPGYRSYMEDDEKKEYPFSGYLASIPSCTVGERFGGKSVAVGNRSMFMHSVTGADIAIECLPAIYRIRAAWVSFIDKEERDKMEEMTEGFPEDWRKVVEFHGHVCPGLATGYRLAKAALAALGYKSPDEGDLVTLAENDRCTIDPFQIVLGCTIGKGKLYIHNTGKQAFTVGCRKSGKAVRVIQLPYAYSVENDDLTRRVRSGRVSDEEYLRYKGSAEARIREIMTSPEAALLKVEAATATFPEKEMIFNSPCCEFCGEQVMEPWTRLREGKIACMACAITVER